MPILCTEKEDDVALISKLAERVCFRWNTNGGTDFGIQLFHSDPAIKWMSDYGDRVLASFFPDEPGPFKRLSALLVLARLTPIFQLASCSSNSESIKPVSAALYKAWIDRVCTLLLPMAIETIKVDDGSGEYRYRLDEWHDFHSLHSKTEFLFWLEWIGRTAGDQLVEPISDEQTIWHGQIIFSTALILEQAYYNTKPNGLCGICDKTLMRQIPNNLLFYDAYLHYNKTHPQSAKSDDFPVWLRDKIPDPSEDGAV